MNRKKLLSLLVITMGIALGAVAVLTITGVLAFTEPSAGPPGDFDEPATEDSTGKLQEIIGTSNAVTTDTTNLFDYLRQIDTNEGGTPQAIAEDQTDEGKLQDLLGASATAADGKTIFNYLKKIDENLPSGGPDYSKQKHVIYDDWNCSANNAEASGSCAAGDPEYTGEEASWTLYTDTTPPGTLSSGKVYKDGETSLYWSDKTTSTKTNSFTINCSDADIINGTCDPCSYATKGDAITFCCDLSLDADGSGDETDWRLPTQKELQQAYIDGAANNLPHPGSSFWSSTEHYAITDNAWNVNLNCGITYHYAKSSSYYVRCVRP